MPKPKSTKHQNDILRGLRDPDRYDPRQRGFTGPWRMVKCKDGPYVDYDEHKEVVDYLRKFAEINPAQSPHDGIHTCSKGCKKPGCNRRLRETIEEQNAQIEALKQDLLEQAAAVRHLRMKRIHDLNQIGGLQEENARLRAEVERLTWLQVETLNERNKAEVEVERLNEALKDEQAVSGHRADEVTRFKAEVERLTAIVGADAIDREHGMCCDSASEAAALKAEVERLRKAGDAMASSIQFNEEMAQDYNGPTIVHQCVQRWRAAKEGKPNL